MITVNFIIHNPVFHHFQKNQTTTILFIHLYILNLIFLFFYFKPKI